jgi:hypothetical protein
LAKRVSALDPAPIMTSISATPAARAAACTNPKISSERARVRRSDSFIGAADFHIAEARRACAVAGSHDLLGLAFSAIGSAPQSPVLWAAMAAQEFQNSVLMPL